MASNPFVSVIVPTHNRCADVVEAVRSLLAQDYPDFEVVVVANNCSDGTNEAMQKLATEDHRLRYVAEPTPGLGYARNRGCQEARAQFLAFLDDDELAPPHWLSSLVRAWQETGGGGVGGPYQPLWQAPPPRWLERSRCLQETLSFMDFGATRRPVEFLLGGNALYTRRALEDAAYFGSYSSLTSKRSLVGGGDIALGMRLNRAGHEIWFEPQAAVLHKVPGSRMRLSYIAKRAFWAGYTDVAIGREWKLGHKATKALSRGPDAVLLGLSILPGTLYGRMMARLGYLRPQDL